MSTHWNLLRDVLPADHAGQVNSLWYVEKVMTGDDAPGLVVDLGCGSARTFRIFRQYRDDVQWVGVDIPDSQEAENRPRGDENLVYYDGVNLPFRNGSIPLVYSHQVMEHVRYPWLLVREIYRVLSPGGRFIGSTSQLEPYHSRSLWNYTLYGFRALVEDAGMRLLEVRPSIDGIALITRAYRGRPPELSRYFVEESPLNQEIDAWGSQTARTIQQINNRKLEFCGQFAFYAEKPRVPEQRSAPVTGPSRQIKRIVRRLGRFRRH